MVQLRQQLALELMREADVGTVQEIEREIFATPWPRNAYYRELASRASAHYMVLRQEGLIDTPPGFKAPDLDPTIIGYGGMWRMYDEAHVTTIGVHATCSTAATAGSSSRASSRPPMTWARSGSPSRCARATRTR